MSEVCVIGGGIWQMRSVGRKIRLRTRAMLDETVLGLPGRLPFACQCCGGLPAFRRDIKPIYHKGVEIRLGAFGGRSIRGRRA